LYARVSTSNQAEDGESLDEQIEKLKNFCEYKGWENKDGFMGAAFHKSISN
jgi:site-specific DNA recombinase